MIVFVVFSGRYVQIQETCIKTHHNILLGVLNTWRWCIVIFQSSGNHSTNNTVSHTRRPKSSCYDHLLSNPFLLNIHNHLPTSCDPIQPWVKTMSLNNTRHYLGNTLHNLFTIFLSRQWIQVTLELNSPSWIWTDLDPLRERDLAGEPLRERDPDFDLQTSNLY